jgi:hypothetical protein
MKIIGTVENLSKYLGKDITATVSYHLKEPHDTWEEFALERTMVFICEDPLIRVGDEVIITIERKYK